MTIGVSKEHLLVLQASIFARDKGREDELRLLTILTEQCKELNQWLPIDENTPKDIPLLLKANCGVAVEGSFNGCYWEEHFLHTEIRPTHYQELPDDPKEQEHAKNS